MPSAIKLKKLTASNWAAENEEEAETAGAAEAEAVESDKVPQEKKSSKKALFSRGDVEILDAKRKRPVPVKEQILTDWLKGNFEAIEDGYITSRKLYDLYTEACSLGGMNLPDQSDFNKLLSNVLGKRPKGKQYGVKDGSEYTGLVPKKRKKPKAKVADSLKLKMKDIITEALTNGGNPKKGLRFAWLKQYIISKYPALRLDLYPAYLKNALIRCVRFGQLECVRGIGMAGFYRLPGEFPEDEDDGKKKKKVSAKKDSVSVKKAEEGKEGEETTDSIREEEVNGKADEGAADDGKQKKDPKEKPKKKRNKKRPAAPKFSRASRHVEPQTVSDVFPMAMTFMCEPKDASATKIKKYITKYFPGVQIESRFKKALLNGCEKGLWEQVSGSGTSGSFRLQVDDINPLHCSTLEDMICLAILACHEPKQSSAVLLKQYITEYHPNFKIDKRPYLFKMALEKEVKHGNLIRLTGIGGTGSFQLAEPFTPCPNWLGGEEESDVEEYEEEALVGGKEEEYKARPTQGRGRGRAATAKGRPPDFISYSTAKAAKAAKTKSRKRRISYKEETEEESEGEVEVPKKKIKQSRQTSPLKKKKSKPATESESKSGIAAKKSASKRKGNRKKAEKVERQNSLEELSEDEDENPKPSTSGSNRRRSSSKLQSKKSTGSKSRAAKSPSRGRSIKGKSNQRSLEESDSEEEGQIKTSPRKKKTINYFEGDADLDDKEWPGKSRSKKSSSQQRDMSDSELEDGELEPRQRGKAKHKITADDDSEDEWAAKVKSKPSKRGQPDLNNLDSDEEGEIKKIKKAVKSTVDQDSAKSRKKAKKRGRY